MVYRHPAAWLIVAIVLAAIVTALASYGIYTVFGQIDLRSLPPGIAETLKLLPPVMTIIIFLATVTSLTNANHRDV